jgi:predicted aldo/keto reductase-like oxidoreductase
LDKLRLGKTELMVNRIGFGGIPIQRLTEDEAVKVVRRCLDLGVNFLDTANGYTTSEERIGKAIKGRRDDVYIATKTGARTREGIEEHLELSLKRLDVDYIDLYQFHGVNDMATMDKILDPEDGLYQVFEDARKAGKIRHIGITSHQIDAARKQVQTGRFETIMFPFNFITCEPAYELLPLCREHDVGFIDMKPMGGGMLENAAVAFKYLFRFPDIVLIPGIQDIREIEEIIRLYESPHEMTAAEKAEMKRLTEELGTRFCRRCEYCQPCPQEIPISMLMTFPTFVKRLPPDWYLKGPWIPQGMEKAANCAQCGECEAKCPYNLPIQDMIVESYNLYQEMKSKYGSPATS